MVYDAFCGTFNAAYKGMPRKRQKSSGLRRFALDVVVEILN